MSTSKAIVLGIDAMDPRITKRFLSEGALPNIEKLIHRGSCRADLTMLGGHPTITPPMWCTMSTGAYANVHGLTCYNAQNPDDIIGTTYGFTSANVRAEQLFNVCAQEGKKTLVWHWPGGAWPPTIDNENLITVDGTGPSAVGVQNGVRDEELVVIADVKTPASTFNPKAASDTHIPCVVKNLEIKSDGTSPLFTGKYEGQSTAENNIIIKETDGEGGVALKPFDVVLSPIKEAHGWKDAPEDAKEFTILLSQGTIRRPSLILKNSDGKYNHIKIYKKKSDTEPICTLEKDVYTTNIFDEAIKDDVKYSVLRYMRLIELDETGNHLKLWISEAIDLKNNLVWSPREIYDEIVENVGYPTPSSFVGGGDEALISKCMLETYKRVADYSFDCIKYMIDNKGVEVVFSHLHTIDSMGHQIVKFLKDKGQLGFTLTEEKYMELLRKVYESADDYIGKFLPLLDSGWDILLVSDHGQVCPEHNHHVIGDPLGCTIPVMRALGLTTMVKDENGNDTYEIDWSKTIAVANRGNNIYINLIGRTDHGIIDPKDKYEVEEEIITRMYGYRDENTGKRIFSVVLRNKDAVLLGYGGPECGDICYWTAEGYNLDHGDSLSTTLGCCDTSVSPLFIAAGPHIKEDFTTERIIRQVDVTPTVATILNVRMPNQCEGAPVYQILKK